jgi:hypothetical protein
LLDRKLNLCSLPFCIFLYLVLLGCNNMSSFF